MTHVPTAAAAAFAFLLTLVSCLALALGLATPQHHGVLFWAVTAGFAAQALAGGVWIARLVAISLRRTGGRGTGGLSGH